VKALVTGATGFTGRYLVRHLLASGDQVLATGRREAADGLGAPYRSCDLLDADAVSTLVRETEAQVIYHLAGKTFVPAGTADPHGFYSVNAVGTLNLLEAVRRSGIASRLVYIGSGYEYGHAVAGEGGLLPETAQVHPQGPYGASKLCGEMLVEQYGQHSGLEAVLLRPFNLLGPGQDPDFAVSCFARQVAEIESGRKPAVVETGNLDSVRDYTDVRDVVQAYRLAGVTSPVRNGPFNVCSGRGWRMRDILSALYAESCVTVETKVLPERLRPNEIPELVGDPRLFREWTGWSPRRDIGETLREVLEMWRTVIGEESRGMAVNR